jgi:DNA-binding LytR/AlgR family response regulator
MLQSLGTEYAIHTASNAAEAYEKAEAQHMDLIFMDIGLPDSSGLELAARIRKLQGYQLVWIVFLTTYTHYILHAFRRIHCYDYLIKPYKIEKVLEYAKLLTYGQQKQPPESKKYITFQMKGYVLKVNLDDILFVEVYNKVCTIHTHKQKSIIKRMPLTKLLKLLPSDHFIQCHRSYVINSEKVYSLKKTQGICQISFQGYDGTAPVGESFEEGLLKILTDKKAKEEDHA